MKRLFDLALSMLLVLLIWPVMLLLAFMVRVDSKGPALYRQKRVGRFGKTFNMYKFRSMQIDADQIGGYQTNMNDQRITRVGKFIRKTSLDELPQILNVIKGDMSLVGPRPDVPQQKELYTEEDWSSRTSVKPGITGLAQATLRSAATAEQRLQLDLDYVRNQSVWFDIKILFQTLLQIMKKGSY